MSARRPPTRAPTGELTAFQREVLARLFETERDFFLTGGAALVGYYLHHRATDDLDLFTLDDEAFARGPRVIADVAHALGARAEVRQESPSFRRSALVRADDLVMVDLVLERVHQLHARKNEVDHVRLDTPDEILANKDGGCTPATLAWLLSEIRIPDDAILPAGVAPAVLRTFIDDVIVRMRRAALAAK